MGTNISITSANCNHQNCKPWCIYQVLSYLILTVLCLSFRLCTRKLFCVLEKIVVFYLLFLWEKKLWLKKQRKGGGEGEWGAGDPRTIWKTKETYLPRQLFAYITYHYTANLYVKCSNLQLNGDLIPTTEGIDSVHSWVACALWYISLVT